MKRYKLLKDLPTFKAGEEFFISKSGNLIAGTPSDPKRITVETRYGLPMKIDLMAYAKETLEEFPNILKDWFEEINNPNEYYYVTDTGYVGYVKDRNEEPNNFLHRLEIGNTFDTKKEAEKYLEYLKAKTIIKQDAKGFKPDWEDKNEDKWHGTWGIMHKELSTNLVWFNQEDTIYFQTEEDIKESFKKHPNEWKTYLTYEQ